VISIRPREEFDAKVVDSKGKCCASIHMAPETRGLSNWKVSIRGQVCLDLIVRKDGSLFEAIHTFADLKVDKVFGAKVLIGEIVPIDDFLGSITAMNSHVLVDGNVRDKEKIL
jgi:hypothetical protein